MGDAYDAGPGDPRLFFVEFKKRIFLFAKQNVVVNMEASSKCNLLLPVANTYLYTEYPFCIKSKKPQFLINIWVRFNTRNHYLRVETGIWQRPKLERHERVCRVCNDVVEDEIHFVMTCPLYSSLRNYYITRHIDQSLPVELAYHNLMFTETDGVFFNLCHFLSRAQELYKALFLQR